MHPNNRKILIYGYFDYRSNHLDGQNVKTRNIRQLLEDKVGKANVDYFDTADIRHNPLSMLLLFRKVWNCRQLIWLPAENNLLIHGWILDIFSRIRHFSILYIVVGGWLIEACQKHPNHISILRRMKGIFTETERMKDDLAAVYDLHNAHWFPNFRFSTTLPQPIPPINQKLNLVFMARINRKKGLDWIFSMGKILEEKGFHNQVTLDFYGLMYAPDEVWFNEQLSQFNWMNYKGLLQESEINSALSQYDLMLLPTHYYTEGMPGSVLDAYETSLPVLVTNWKHASEFVQNRITGYIVDFDKGLTEMTEIICSLLKDKSPLIPMRQNAYTKSRLYSGQNAWNILSPFVSNW